MLRQLSSQWGFYSSVLKQRIRNHSACRRTCHPKSRCLWHNLSRGCHLSVILCRLVKPNRFRRVWDIEMQISLPPHFNIDKMLSLRQHFTFCCNAAVVELVRSIYGKRPPCNLILLVTPVNQVRPIFCQENWPTFPIETKVLASFSREIEKEAHEKWVTVDSLEEKFLETMKSGF